MDISDEAFLRHNERFDDLLTHQFRIIQSDEVFSFSMDAVLLAHFCTVPNKGEILDLCTGNGIVPLLLATRSKARITGIDIQDRLVDMAQRSVKYNGLEEQITIEHEDLKQYHLRAGHGKYDMITVNPPYLPPQQGVQNKNAYVAIARHEMCCTLEDVIAASSKLIRFGGKVAIVHRPARLMDLLSLLRQYRLEPKRVRFVHPKATAEANMVLIEAVKEGKPDIRLLPPLIVYNEQHHYTEELLQLYYGRN